MNETPIEKKCKEIARAHGWYARKFVSPAHRSAPDDVFIKEGRHVFIEFKRPGKHPTELQWKEIMDINQHGGEAYWCSDIEDFKGLLGIEKPVCDNLCQELSHCDIQALNILEFNNDEQ